jgi:hypothetical protein
MQRDKTKLYLSAKNASFWCSDKKKLAEIEQQKDKRLSSAGNKVVLP